MRLLAHGLGGRADLPVPVWMAQYAAALVLIVTFFMLARFWESPRLQEPYRGRPLPTGLQRLIDAPAFRLVLRLIGLAVLLIAIVVAAFGTGSSATNPAPTWLYVWFWVGIVPLSLLFGPVLRAFSPLRLITQGIARLSGRRDPEDFRALPDWLGFWPAAAGLLIFTWLELVYRNPDRPQNVLAFIVLYCLVELAAAAVYGTRWYAHGDPFEVYSTLVGRLSPFGRRPEDGRLVLRNPLAGLASVPVEPGIVAVICVLLGSTAFDGLSRTQWWQGLSSQVTGPAYVLLGTAGLLVMVGLVSGAYLAATRQNPWARRGQKVAVERRFVHSLLPIAVGYTVAHYFSLVVFQGQAGYQLASDPLGRGWDLFGTAGQQINYRLVATTTIAIVQVVAILTGHVLGVFIAHDRAIADYTRSRQRLRAQYPLLVVMVTYTLGGIALLLGA
jgi:hypothetical protein